MKIYTRTGDKGLTSLFGGKRVSKDHLRIDAYGTVDELNSLIGVCRSMNQQADVDAILSEIQNDLFALGADLATPSSVARSRIKRMTSGDAARLERHIDRLDAELRPLSAFILPGGNRTAALLHFARTVCRRAERLSVRLVKKEHMALPPVVYLNRLSDLLFVIARWVNHVGNTPETEWHQGPPA